MHKQNAQLPFAACRSDERARVREQGAEVLTMRQMEAGEGVSETLCDAMRSSGQRFTKMLGPCRCCCFLVCVEA